MINLIIKNVIFGGKKTDLKIGSSDKVIDSFNLYAHRCFVDTHMHILVLGVKLLTHDLEKEKLNELLNSGESPLIARGWSEMPPIELINSVDYPVALIRKCGHKAVVNDAAKKLLNLESNILLESEVDKIYKLLAKNDYKRALKAAERELFKVGISYVHSDDLHSISFDDLAEILQNSKIRIYEKLFTYDPKEDMFGKISERVYFGAIKLYSDGSIGARTAFMKKPYVDTKENGVFLLSSEILEKVFEFGKKTGVEIAIHAIGDAALERLAPYFNRYPGNRIIHAQFVSENALPLLKHTHFSVQPHFYFEDQETLKYVRTTSLKYPFLRLHKEGYDISFSSDAPVSPHDPRYVAQAALKMGFSKEEAMELYTKGSKDLCLYESEDPLESYPVAIVMEDGEVIDLG